MPDEQRRARLHVLDGMRGWAATSVLFYHVFCDGFPISESVSKNLRLFLPFNAMIAVFLFFIISGFALSVPYLTTLSRQAIYRTVIGRYFRLAIPIFGACLLVHLAMQLHLLLPPQDRPPIFREYLTFKSNLAHLFYFSLVGVFWHYNEAVSYIAPLWTMSIELIGGFLTLGLLALVGSYRVRWLIYAAIAACFLFFKSYYFLFIAGLILADVYYSYGLSITKRYGLILLLIGVAAPFILPWTVSALTMLASVAIFVSFMVLNSWKNFFSTPLSGFLGNISFPLYLLHGPIMSIVGLPLMQSFGSDPVGALLVRFVVIIVSFWMAWLFSPVNNAAVLVSRSLGRRTIFWCDRLQNAFGLEKDPGDARSSDTAKNPRLT